MSRERVVVLRPAGESAPPWEAALAGSACEAADPADGEALRHALRDAVCVLVDGTVAAALERVRRAYQVDPTVQAAIVAPAPEHTGLSRTILFTPGIGEVWLLSPAEVGQALIERAAQVTRSRRGYRQTRSRIAQDLAALGAPRDRRAVISDAYLAALLDAVPDPVLSVDEDGRVLSWNPGAERVLGYPRGEAVGRVLTELLGPGMALPAAGEPGSAPGPVRREAGFRRRSGEEGVGELIVAPVEAGGLQVRAVVLHDLSEERRAQAEIESQAVELEAQAAELEMVNDELQSRTVELEHAARARDRFYAAMSHELRTPINAILGFIDLVLTGVYGPVAAKQEEGLTRAQRAARHLHELVNDVLDLARIEAGRMEVQVEPTLLPWVVEEVIDTVRALADQRGVEVSVHGPGTHTIRTDPRRLRQILLNLLSNAIKFGLGRPVEVRWEPTDDGGVSIDVVDRGSGIPAQDLERIFDEFIQIGGEPNAGTGLGLPISRRLAELLGGTLEAVSDLGHGSTFRLVLPATRPEDRFLDLTARS